jgi:hypothetical protein
VKEKQKKKMRALIDSLIRYQPKERTRIPYAILAGPLLQETSRHLHLKSILPPSAGFAGVTRSEGPDPCVDFQIKVELSID